MSCTPRASDSWGSGLLQQVKSLGSVDFVKGVGSDYAAEYSSKLPARKMDCSTQTSQLGIDVKIPNRLPYFDPAEHEAEAGVQTDVMPSSLKGETWTMIRTCMPWFGADTILSAATARVKSALHVGLFGSTVPWPTACEP